MKDWTRDLKPVCLNCRFWNSDSKDTGRCLHSENDTERRTSVYFTCDKHEYLTKPSEQFNPPIQIQQVIIDSAQGHHFESIEFLTVLFRDGTIQQGCGIIGLGEHIWTKINLPKDEQS